MWWVWRRSLHLHIGRGFAIAQLGSAQAQVIRFPSTLPLNRQLAQIADTLTDSIGSGSRALHVTLSGALCPAVGFPVPNDVKRRGERLEIARACAATRLNVSADEIACDFDPERTGIAAAMPSTLLIEIKEWARQRKFKLLTLAPLWAMATECSAARKRAVQSVAVHEPDSLTLLHAGANGAADATTVPTEGDVMAGRALAESWLGQRGAESARVVHLGFGAKSAGGSGLPLPFRAYWTAL